MSTTKQNNPEDFDTMYFNLKMYSNSNDYMDNELYNKLLVLFLDKFIGIDNHLKISGDNQKLFIDWSKKLFGLTLDSFNLDNEEIKELDKSQFDEYLRIRESLEYIRDNVDNFVNDEVNLKFHIDRTLTFFQKADENLKSINQQLSSMCDKLDHLVDSLKTIENNKQF
tara:strand:- start:493 stop:996 length:504 start_codon:yes stop_codon:yes gene_type:complete